MPRTMDRGPGGSLCRCACPGTRPRSPQLRAPDRAEAQRAAWNDHHRKVLPRPVAKGYPGTDMPPAPKFNALTPPTNVTSANVTSRPDRVTVDQAQTRWRVVTPPQPVQRVVANDQQQRVVPRPPAPPTRGDIETTAKSAPHRAPENTDPSVADPGDLR